MIRLTLFATCIVAHTLPAAADMPPGVTSARLLPGWIDIEGNRLTALELLLETGWKTYWRSPGDSGLPPRFDWTGSGNLSAITLHWPAPEAIRSGESLSLGYHDRLVLPLTASPEDPAQPLDLHLSVDLGVCEKVCVPVHLNLTAPNPGDYADPVIKTALARVPIPTGTTPPCKIEAIADGNRVSVTLPPRRHGAVAMELVDHPEIWVSSAEITQQGEAQLAVADFVPPDAEPFDMDASALLLTLLSPDGATEIQGCAPQSAG